MANEKQLAELPGEYQAIGEVLIELIKQCPYTPDASILYNAVNDNISIGIYTANGTFTENVIGGYDARCTFQVAYKSFPTTNKQNMRAQSIVDDMMGWLKDIKNLPQLTDGRTITKITVSSAIPYKDTESKDGAITYVANGVLLYEK